jgi:hypothetical protein
MTNERSQAARLFCFPCSLKLYVQTLPDSGLIILGGSEPFRPKSQRKVNVKTSELAQSLREHHYQLGLSVPDKIIIKAYTRCQGCGGPMLDKAALKQCIRKATDAESFLELIEEASFHHDEPGDDGEASEPVSHGDLATWSAAAPPTVN